MGDRFELLSLNSMLAANGGCFCMCFCVIKVMGKGKEAAASRDSKLRWAGPGSGITEIGTRNTKRLDSRFGMPRVPRRY